MAAHLREEALHHGLRGGGGGGVVGRARLAPRGSAAVAVHAREAGPAAGGAPRRRRRVLTMGMMYPMESALGRFWKATPTTTLPPDAPRSAGPPLRGGPRGEGGGGWRGGLSARARARVRSVATPRQPAPSPRAPPPSRRACCPR